VIYGRWLGRGIEEVDIDSLSDKQKKQIWGDSQVTTPALAVVMPDGFVLLSNTDILP